MQQQAAIDIEVIGYCHEPVAGIIARIIAGRARELTSLGGNFIIIAHRAAIGGQQATTWIASSAYGVVSYFYHQSAGRDGKWGFHHGRDVAAITRAAGLDWAWDHQALADLFCLEHLTGDASLHAAVKRVPAASLLHWDGAKLDLWTADVAALHASATDQARRFHGRALADHMVDLFTAELAEAGGPNAVLSASGGFDSRLLLAGQLAAGAKPDLVVMGQPGSTDREVSVAISQRFDLSLRAVDLEAADYVAAALPVTQATNGTKPLAHWHTYIYTAKSGLGPNDRFLVGSNGETVRSFYYDQGIKARLADLLPGAAAAERYWRRHLQPDLTAEEKRQLPPPLGKLLAGDLGAEAARCAALGAVGNPQASMMTRLDRFYLDQRVRLFIGNGLTLYGLTTDWRTPFLSIPWVAATGLLPRAWKLGSNWHRHAINRLCPALLDFPEERLGPRMAARAPAFYWHRRRRTQPVVPYVDYRKLIATPAILDLLADHAGAIDDLLPRPAITALIDGVRAGKRGQRSFSILTSLALWRWQMRNR